MNEQSIKNLEEQTRKVFNKVIQSPELMNELGRTVVEDIQFQTKRGKSIPNGLKPFKKLSESWIETRGRITSSLSDTFSKRRSNLSASGQLLNGLKWFIEGAGKIRIGFTGSHQPYTIKRKDGKGTYKSGEALPNEELAQYVADQGRPFVGVSPQVQTRLKSRVLAYIRRSARVLRAFSMK